MKKHIAILLALIILMISLVSCHNGKKSDFPDGAVLVLSNYPNLSYILPGAYDTAKFEDGTWARNGYSTYVKAVGGKLAVLPSHVKGSSSAPYISQSNAYTFENVKGGFDGIYVDGVLSIAGRRVGMIHSYAKDKLLVFTTAGGNGTVHLFEKTEDSASLVLSEQTISVDGEIYLVYFDWKNMNFDAPEKIYVITSYGDEK